MLGLTIDSGRNLDIHDDTTNARRNDQRGVLNVSCLLAENGTKQFLFRSKLSFRLRSNLADKDVAWFNLSSYTDDTVVVEILKSFFTNVRNITSDFFRAELGVTRSHLELVDMNRCKDVILDDLFRDQDRILEIITIPRHESHEDVTTNGKLAILSRSTIRKDLAFLYRLSARNNWLLIKACARIGTHKLTKVVDKNVLLSVGLDVLGFYRNFAVLSQNDSVGIDLSDDPIYVSDLYCFGVDRNAFFNAGAHEWGVGLKERHTLTLHIRSHECAIGIIVFEERNEARCNRNKLLR